MEILSLKELTGIVAGLCFAFSAAPQALKCYKQKHAHGVSTAMLLLWITGEVCAIIYTSSLWRQTLPLFLNYFLNLAFISVILYYRLYPREELNE